MEARQVDGFTPLMSGIHENNYNYNNYNDFVCI